MDANHVDASICFPNTLPRFCGQTFYERADKDLALLCVQAYNDWMIDEWCAGDGKGRLIPLTHACRCGTPTSARRRDPALREQGQLRDHVLREPVPARPAVDPRQGQASGTRCSPRARRPRPSSACTSARRRRCRRTSPDAPFIVSSTLTFSNAMGSMLDYIFSGTLERFPTLTLAYSEGQVGWMPYVLERADKLWAERSDNTLRHRRCRSAPSELHARPGLRLHLRRRDRPRQPRRDRHGPDLLRDRLPARRQHVPALARRSREEICAKAGLDDDEIYKFIRGNAIRAFGLERFGITK